MGDADRGARTAHVEGERAVAHHDAHALEGNVDLLRDHLRDRGAEPLPAVDLAVVRDDRAVGFDTDIGRKLIAGERRPRGRAVCTRGPRWSIRKCDDQRAASREKRAPAER